VDTAPDAHLFVLDDAGVFFSVTRQELSLFNTAATLVWCLIEQRLAGQEIVRAYQRAFGLDAAEATHHVSAILQQWFGLGYISRPDPTSAPEVPLTTALAQILTNPQLRSQFRHAPREVADALCVAREEMDNFVRLHPDDLDAQADEVAKWRTRYAPERGALEDKGSAEVGKASHTLAEEPRAARWYRLLTTMFELRVESDALASQLHEALAHLECSEATPDVVLHVRPSGRSGWNVLSGGVPVEPNRLFEEVVPAVKRLMREASVDRSEFVIRMHAAVVSFGNGCVLMPASAGSGKTTLTAALIRSGATYFSDEVALLESGELAVRPVPVSLTVKEGGVEPLRRFYPEIDSLTSHLREDHVMVRYLRPPDGSLPANERAQQVKWIVFPHYDSTVQTKLVPVARPVALRSLLRESVVVFDRLNRDKVESLVQGMRSVECYDLSMSSLEPAVALVRSLMVA
jgi:hypothetical protein